MSEPRKNHLTIDGGQVKEDEQIASYKPIPESETEFRSSKPNLSKSKEKVSSDGAEEKLLQKEDEAKITTRVDMADAKYVVGDHRNGDAKIELDANKRQFSGLTKEELLEYAEDPFWVRLRWFMFVLFWAMWLCMLAGAIAIIIRAPKCAPPPPKTWFQKGPLVDVSSLEDYHSVESELPLLQKSKVEGIFVAGCKETYDVLKKDDCITQFKTLVTKAKEYGIKLIVDLTANFVSKSDEWFRLSENREGEYADYFIWSKNKGFNETGNPNPPNKWVSTLDTPAWTWSKLRNEFYLHQYDEDQPDLNFANPAVVRHFDHVIEAWMKAGAAGIRLQKARQLFANGSLVDEDPRTGHGSVPGADHQQYAYWQHKHSSDHLALDSLLAHWSYLVDRNGVNPGAGETVFTLAEDGKRTELFLLERNTTSLRPPSAAPQSLNLDPAKVVKDINVKLGRWPALQLIAEDEAVTEAAALALLLPAAPVLSINQLDDNSTSESESLSRLVALREDPSVEHGNHTVTTVSARNHSDLIACARWKAGHTGYLAVFNPSPEEAHADLSSLHTVPDSLTVHHMSQAVRLYTNYTSNYAVESIDVLVPPKSTLVLSYVPKSTAEK